MRIISGKYKGKKLINPSNDEIRPSSDRLRETIFNVLDGGRYGNILDGELIIDLFSGTGALGLEAVSRGNPKKVIFVDNSQKSVNIINSNIESLKLNREKTKVLLKDATDWIDWKEEKIGLIFSDPPYFKDLSLIALTALAKIQAIKNGAIIILENAKNEEIPEINNFDLIETRKIRKSKINFFVFKN